MQVWVDRAQTYADEAEAQIAAAKGVSWRTDEQGFFYDGWTERHGTLFRAFHKNRRLGMPVGILAILLHRMCVGVFIGYLKTSDPKLQTATLMVVYLLFAIYLIVYKPFMRARTNYCPS